jgi:hypothetical protein
MNGIREELIANDGDERHHVCVILLIGRDHIDKDLDFVLESFREKLANLSVDDARLEDFRIGGPAFSLDEAAGNLARRVGLVLVLYEEREEWEGTFGVTDRYCRENHRLAKLDQCGSCCLLRHAACLDD